MRFLPAPMRLILAAAFAATLGAPLHAQVGTPQPGGPPPNRLYPGGEVNMNPAPLDARLPRDDILEVMIKSALMAFNDANLTGNYAVLNARLHPVFREQAPPQRLASTFAAFRTNKVDIAPLLVHRHVLIAPPAIDGEGHLVAKGEFETQPWHVVFDLAWRREGDRWWLWRLNVRVKPPEQQ